jgi:polyisoprenyl-phosphate glycosyltransferase
VATYVGLITATIAVMYGLYMMARTILFGNPVAGYPSLLVIILFLGGVQLLSLGVIGEYVGRIFNETKQRPLYLVDSVLLGKASTLGRRLASPPDCAELPSAMVDRPTAAVQE